MIQKDTLAVARDDIPLAGRGPADQSTRTTVANAAVVPERNRTGHVSAKEVAANDRSNYTSCIHSNPVLGTASDQVTRSGQVAA